jgi:hypothetical protein
MLFEKADVCRFGSVFEGILDVEVIRGVEFLPFILAA